MIGLDWDSSERREDGLLVEAMWAAKGVRSVGRCVVTEQARNHTSS